MEVQLVRTTPFLTFGKFMGFLSSIFGSTPHVPKYTPVSPQGAQATAIAGNAAALPAAQGVASSATAFNQNQISAMLEKYAPGFGAESAAIGKNTTSELNGEIPTDVSDAIQKSSAARALTGGFGGSGLSGNMLAKNLGLTSLDLIGMGTSAAESWAGIVDRIFGPGVMDVTSMFISPQQQFQAETKNAEDTWNAKWLQSQVAAQPNPVMSGLFKTFTGTAALEAYGGGNPFGGNSGMQPSSGIGVDGFSGTTGAGGSSSLWDGTFGAGAGGAAMAGGAGDAIGAGASGAGGGLLAGLV